MMRDDFNTGHLMDLDNPQQHAIRLQYSSDNSSSSNSNFYSNTHSPQPQYTQLEVQQMGNYRISQQAPQLGAMAIEVNSHVPMVQFPPCKPKLVILEEPADKFRFRYSSEMHGTHGSLMGELTQKNKKTYPQVKLEGYHGKAVIRVTLYQEKTTDPSPHSHSLVVRNNERDECDPHYFDVDGSKDLTTIKCQGMGIIHTAKKEIKETLRTKLEALWRKENNAEIGHAQRQEFKEKADTEAKSMNLNQVRLCFEAFQKNPNGTLSPIDCMPVLSKPINNMKSALTGEVKICKLSAAVSSAEGGDDLFLLVEKVNKKNIKVRFFQEGEKGETLWEDWGKFSESDVHHQYAIALRTPPYINKDIAHVVDVKIQLVRESDKDASEPMPFKYKPRHAVSSRKRRRLSNSTLSSGDLPTTFNYNIQSVSSSEGSDGMSISTEYGKEAILSEFNSPQLTSDEFSLCQKDLHGNSVELSAFINVLNRNSDELRKLMDPSILSNFEQCDGEEVCTDGTSASGRTRNAVVNEELIIKKARSFVNKVSNNESTVEDAKSNVEQIFNFYESVKKETLINHLIATENTKLTQVLFQILEKIDFYEPLNRLEGSDNPLYVSCVENQSIFVRSLLSYGCNPNTCDEKTGDTPLHIAANENYLECAEAIIRTCKSKKINLDINTANFDGMSCLHKAIRQGHLEMVKLLINEGEASAKLAISKTGNNSLMLAVEAKQPYIVEFLLKSTKVKPTAKNSSGLTALEMAKTSNENAIARMLMENMRISDADDVVIKEESEGESDSQSTDTVDYLQWDDDLIERLSNELGDRWPQLADAAEVPYAKKLMNTSLEFIKFLSKNIYENISKLKFSEYVSKMQDSTAEERAAIDQIIGLL